MKKIEKFRTDVSNIRVHAPVCTCARCAAVAYVSLCVCACGRGAGYERSRRVLEH